MAENRFPLGPTWHELNRGVDPEVAADIGYEVPEGIDAADIQRAAQQTEIREEYVPPERRDWPANRLAPVEKNAGRKAIEAMRRSAANN